MAAASSSTAPHVHHPKADSTVEFHGYAAYEKKGDVKPFSYNPPKLADDFVEIDIECCGICGSDIHTIDSGWGPSNYPVIVGHEIIGRVVAAGKDVKNVRVGDRVGVGAQCGSCLNKSKKDCDACATGNEQMCAGNIWTYNTHYDDGQLSQGGYANRVRCQSAFAFEIPHQISSAEAAPLMCAGVTVFAPLQRYITRKNMRVAVIGIGGLGHLAVKYAAKLLELQGGGELTAVSHNSKKKDDALKMGAHKFLDTSDKGALSKAGKSFDLVLSTANGTGQDWNSWLSTVAVRGIFCTVGLPEEPLQIAAFSLMASQIYVTASGIGSIVEIEQMLAFSARWGIRPIIERLPMAQANEGIQRVRDGSVRFRVVLENPPKA